MTKVQINSMEDLHNCITKYNIPIEILNDVDKRITDWLASGGSLEDDYIKQQFRYVANYISRVCIS